MRSKNESLISTIELGRAIKRRREELKLSLRDVADKTDVSAVVVAGSVGAHSAVADDRSPPSAETKH